MKLHLTKLVKIILVMMYLMAIITNLSIAAFDVTGNFSGETDANVAPIKTTIATVLDVVRFVGMGIALIIVITIGIKIMIAAPSERANIKQYAINYLIGAGILIGASGILTIIKNFTDEAIKPA